MSGRWYAGRTPDTDSSVMPKGFLDSSIASQLVTSDFVNAQIAAVQATLVNQTYVDNADGMLAHKTSVDAADLNYVPSSALGAANGVAQLNSSGQVPAGQIPSNVPLQYKAISYSAAVDGTVNLGSSSAQTVNTSNLREYELASIPVADPGYPWVVWPFAIVQGGDPIATADPGRTAGTGNFGLLSVVPAAGVSDQVYGVGLCTATYRYDFYKVRPYATANQTPTTVPPIHGPLTLNLYGCCWSGSEYVFTGNGLNYWLLVLPAMGS